LASGSCDREGRSAARPDAVPRIRGPWFAKTSPGSRPISRESGRGVARQRHDFLHRWQESQVRTEIPEPDRFPTPVA
jgi:hypothetical protein